METKQLYITLALALTAIVPASAQSKGEEAWLQPVRFEVGSFACPDTQFAPFTRWWWPGNDVEQKELMREVELFAKNHFGGMELQPMSLVMPTKGKGRAERIMSYDTPAYYDNLKVMLEAAARHGLTVDMTNGSGWPSGGAHLTEEDNNLTLEYGMADIPQGSDRPIKLPRAEKDDRPNAKLIAVLAAKATGTTDGSLALDAESVHTLTAALQDSTVRFTPPTDGDWKLIAFWSMADMEKPMLMAKRDVGFAMNHFDSTKVTKNYEHYFGNRTGLAPYMGTTLRAIFNDSYEFRADRHWADDFIETFRKNRGYDPVPLLPANIWYGYNDMYQRMANPNLRPSFRFSDQDWRLRYDYDLTVSDLIRRHLLRASRQWAESRGMIHRTQTYGLCMDMMGAAGDASIPEMETMLFSMASETGYKIISSGAHLYNRPVVSCESAVYINRAFLTTPQKLKMTIDKVLVSGVNQIIWHGAPYSYFPDGYPKEGWYPFWNSAIGVNFSTMLSETNSFWKYIGDINRYAQRAQYALRSGKPKSDVLIYYPFLKYSEAGHNPKELLLNGYLPGVEPALLAKDEQPFDSERETAWINCIQPLIDELNARGITWDWINDESIQVMTLDERGQLDVRGNAYQSLILFDLPYIQLPSARRLKTLAEQGGNVLTIGALPTIQPSYNNWQENDRLTADLMRSLHISASVSGIDRVEEIGAWADRLDLPLKHLRHQECFRQIRRVQDDGSILQMYWNESEAWQPVTIGVNKSLPYAYWMDAEDGSIIEAKRDKEGNICREFGPLSTAFLYCTASPIDLAEVTPSSHRQTTCAVPSFDSHQAKEVIAIETWNLKTDSLELTNFRLANWRDCDTLKYVGAEALYTTEITMKKKAKRAAYYLDLGSVYYSAELCVNGQEVGTRLYAPFLFDVTPYLRKGRNEISVKVTPSLYNEFVKRGIDRDRLFKRLKDSTLTSEGMVGPVVLMKNEEFIK